MFCQLLTNQPKLMQTHYESQNTPPKSQSKTRLNPRVVGISLILSNAIVSNFLESNDSDLKLTRGKPSVANRQEMTKQLKAMDTNF